MRLRQITSLEGVRIVDFTTFLSGPFATQQLADLGADVIKVEPPGGDSSRSVPPHFVGEESAYFLGNNRNKRSLALDLRTDEGKSAAQAIVATADVVIENYRPGVAARLGLDSMILTAKHPHLVWASISGFGQEGDRSELPAYDMIVQALSGVMSLTGEEGRPAIRLGVPAGDLVAGLYAVIGILAALNKRHSTGVGSIIDISMLDCQLALTSYQAVYSMVSGNIPKPQAARHDSIPTYRSFKAQDGRELVITANTDRMWKALCDTLGVPKLPKDARYETASVRLENRESLWQHLERLMLQKTAREWVVLLQQAGVPSALIQNVPEAIADARQDTRNMVLDIESPEGHAVSVIGNPVKFLDASTVEPEPKYPPALGADGREILEEAGLSRDAIESLISKGVVIE